MAHVFDLASNWPADTNILITQGWYGIPEDEGGSEADWGVWDISASATWHASNPSAYPYNPYALQDATISIGGHRWIGSNLRPLEGLYSTAGRDAASVAHIDRMLGVVRRVDDPRGRIDVVAPTVGNLYFTSYTGVFTEEDSEFSYGLDRRYRHLIKVIERAEALGLDGCVAANYEAYQVWQNFSDTFTTKLARLAAVALDLQGIVTALKDSDAAFKVDGRLVLFWYEGDLTENITAAEWSGVMESVRKPYEQDQYDPGAATSHYGTGHDFYVCGRNYGAGDVSWMDGLHPWVRLNVYDEATGTEREKAATWAEESVTDYIQNAVTNNPTRIALGNFSMGFESWVKGWGAGDERMVPRNLSTLLGQFDGYAAIESAWQRLAGIVIVTWDDYPEATCLEPTVQDNGEYLGAWTEAVAAYEGDTPSADETASLLDIWRSVANTSTVTSPVTPRQGGPQAFSHRITSTLPYSTT